MAVARVATRAAAAGKVQDEAHQVIQEKAVTGPLRQVTPQVAAEGMDLLKIK
jgi:hypothetical protein